MVLLAWSFAADYYTRTHLDFRLACTTIHSYTYSAYYEYTRRLVPAESICNLCVCVGEAGREGRRDDLEWFCSSRGQCVPRGRRGSCAGEPEAPECVQLPEAFAKALIPSEHEQISPKIKPALRE